MAHSVVRGTGAGPFCGSVVHQTRSGARSKDGLMYTKAARLARRSAWHLLPIPHILHAARLRGMPAAPHSTVGHVAEPTHCLCRGVQCAELDLPSTLGRPLKISDYRDRVRPMPVAIRVQYCRNRFPHRHCESSVSRPDDTRNPCRHHSCLHL